MTIHGGTKSHAYRNAIHTDRCRAGIRACPTCARRTRSDCRPDRSPRGARCPALAPSRRIPISLHLLHNGPSSFRGRRLQPDRGGARRTPISGRAAAVGRGSAEPRDASPHRATPDGRECGRPLRPGRRQEQAPTRRGAGRLVPEAGRAFVGASNSEGDRGARGGPSTRDSGSECGGSCARSGPRGEQGTGHGVPGIGARGLCGVSAGSPGDAPFSGPLSIQVHGGRGDQGQVPSRPGPAQARRTQRRCGGDLRSGAGCAADGARTEEVWRDRQAARCPGACRLACSSR